MAVIKCNVKGIWYAYESVYQWDKELKQSRCRRRCIGRYNPETGEITPTRNNREKKYTSPLMGKRETIKYAKSLCESVKITDYDTAVKVINTLQPGMQV